MHFLQSLSKWAAMPEMGIWKHAHDIMLGAAAGIHTWQEFISSGNKGLFYLPGLAKPALRLQHV